MGGLSQFFVNGSFVTATTVTALIASPIIIHLINRMRFRKVRFAAMEFLLQAQQRNRRRLLLEQLLLLLLRILIVLAILFLIARLILDPRLTVFGGEGKAHHLVVLDDSASMHNRWGNTSAFEEAKKVILELVREGAKRPQTQTFSLVLASKPTNFLFAEVDVSNVLVKELEEKLDPDTLRASYTRPDLQAALQDAGDQLRKHEATIKHLHVFSDFRRGDWQGNEPLAETINQLEKDEISVNLIRSVEQPLPNVGLTTLDGDLHSAAAGVPVRLRIGVTNFGETVVENEEVSVHVDGDKLPLSVTFPRIEAGQEIVQYKDITFRTEGLHRVQVQVKDDSLSVDNSRYLSIDIPKQNYVLIVADDPNGEAAFSLTQALAPTLELTGIATNVIQSDFLEKELDKGLAQFRAIYMVNVPDIPAKALEMLESYVRGGGGLVWFLGDKVRIDAYNKLSKLELNEEGILVRLDDAEALFPVLLDKTRATMQPDPTIKSPDLNFASHPIFDGTFSKDNPVISQLSVKEYVPVSKEWVRSDAQRKDGVTTVGYSREGDPVVFDHRFGQGRVMTFLTSSGPPWTNLDEIGGLYIPLVQKLQQYVAKPDDEKHVHEIGEVFKRGGLSALDYDSKIFWTRPDDSGELEDVMEHPVLEDGTKDTKVWKIEYADLGLPGIYRYRLLPRSSRERSDLPMQWEFAANVAPEEGQMATASDDEIREHLEADSRVAIHAFGDTEFIGPGTDPGQEVRKYLMYFLLFLLVAEQAMAYRLSYHPETVEALA